MTKNNTTWLLVAALLISVGFNFYQAGDNNDSKYPFLAKRLFAENQNDIVINFNPLRESLRAYPAANGLNMGIYFEYLPSGTSIGVNEKEIFFSASLIKIPVVMRTYRLIEEGSLRADQEVTVEQKFIDKNFGTLWEKGPGAKVTVNELIVKTLTESDSTAYNILGDITQSHEKTEGGTRLTSDVYNYLDIPFDRIGNQYGISPKAFGSVLRSLYLSAYLPYQTSNHILELMSQSTFKKWLPEPIPQDVKVAHKYGVYVGDISAQLVHSDCGIVYYPKRPYLLCVMINTGDKMVAEQNIRAVSKLAFDFVKSVNQ